MKRSSGRAAMRGGFLIALVFLAPAIMVARQKSPQTYRIPLPPKPDFSSLEWMIGNWTGRMDKQSPQGRVQLAVSYGLDKQVMIFRGKVSIAATGEISADNESSIGILSAGPSGNTFLLQVYASTGFISRYRVTVSGSEIDFMPDGGMRPLPGWLSRLFIQRGDVNGFTETVQLAPPMETFFNYYTADFTRRAAPESSKPKESGSSKGTKAGGASSQSTAAAGKSGNSN